jgi:hypothetical protein
MRAQPALDLFLSVFASHRQARAIAAPRRQLAPEPNSAFIPRNFFLDNYLTLW